MADDKDTATILIDGVDYAIDCISVAAKEQIESIQFSDKQISQLKNEWEISNTARTGYLEALKVELSMVDGTDP